MASRLKEDEKNEKAIRGLLKQTPNRRCINCNSLGPQYVCTNFWTFVCTNCSGIHREFTHRVKSVSMAKFTSQEVTALQQGGNQKAREIYFKDYDTSRNQLPDSSNVDKLRDFIKHVYVERRFSGERPPRGKTGFDGPERRSDSRSPSYEENYGERRTGSGSFGGRKYDDRGNVQDERKSPGHYEYDRSRYDRKYDDYKRSPGFEDRRRSDERSPNYQKGYDSNSPPPVRPVREILGDDVPTLRVNDYGSTRSLPEIRKDFRNQRTASSSSMGSIEGTSPTLPRASTSSLIDFSVEPEPSASVSQKESSSVPTANLTPTQVQDPFVPPVRPSSAAAQPDLFAASLTSNPSNVGTQDPFVASFTNQASNARSHDPFAASSTKQSSNAGSQDPFMAAFLGSQAPVPASTTGQQSAPSAGNGGWATFDFGRPAPAGIVPTTLVETNSQVPAQSSASTMATPLDSFGNATTSEGWASQWAAPQTQGTNSLVTNGNNWSATFPQSTSNNNASGLQSWSEILPSTASAPNNTSQNVQQPHSVGKPPIPGTQNALPLQSVAKPPIPSSDTVSQKGQQPTTSKQNGRTEISEDLFKSPYPQPVQQHMGVHHMGVHMVSPYGGVVTPSFPSGGMSFPGSVQFNRPPSRSTNPFDTVTDVPAAHGSSFLNMGSMQNALPNFAAPATVHASIQGPFGTPLGPSPVPAPIQPTAVPGLMSQQLPNQAPFNMHSVAPPTNNFSSASFNGDDFFSNLGNSHYPPQSSVPSVSGNPFG